MISLFYNKNTIISVICIIFYIQILNNYFFVNFLSFDDVPDGYNRIVAFFDKEYSIIKNITTYLSYYVDKFDIHNLIFLNNNNFEHLYYAKFENFSSTEFFSLPNYLYKKLFFYEYFLFFLFLLILAFALLIYLKKRDLTYIYAVVFTLLVPSFSFIMTWISNEVLFLILSIFILPLYLNKFYLIILILLALLFFLDAGNTTIILAFMVYYNIINIIYKKNYTYAYIFVFFTCLITFISKDFTTQFLNLFPYLNSDMIIKDLSYVDNSYIKLIERIVYWYLSLTLVTDSFLIPWFSVCIFNSILLFSLFLKYKNLNRKSIDCNISNKFFAVLIISFVFMCICISPLHANIKYFVFFIPSIMYILLKTFGILRVFNFAVIYLLAINIELYITRLY